MNRRWISLLAIAAPIAILLAVRLSFAAEPDDNGPPDGPPGGPGAESREAREDDAPKAETKKFSGTVTQFNYTPRGERDGILLSSHGKLVQLIFPPHAASEVTKGVAVGDQITAEGTSERAHADHTICRLEKLTNAKGEENSMPKGDERRHGEGPGDGPAAGPGEGPDAGPGDRPDGPGDGPGQGGRQHRHHGPDRGPDADGGPGQGPDAGPGDGPGRGPDAGPGRDNDEGPGQNGPGRNGPPRDRSTGKVQTIKGVVKAFNHAARGEVDGVVLDNGDFIRIGPRDVKSAKLEVGQEVTAVGHASKTSDGHTMIDRVTKINDKTVSQSQRFGRRGPGRQNGPGDQDGPPGRGDQDGPPGPRGPGGPGNGPPPDNN